MFWYIGKLESDSESDDEDSIYPKKQVSDEPIQVELLKKFHGGMEFTPNKIHVALHQVLQRFEEKDGKEIGFLDCDHLHKSTTIKKDEDKSDLFPIPVAQKNLSFDSPEQVNLLESLYNGNKLDHHKINPSLLQNLQKIEEKDGREDQICSRDCILESTMDNNDDVHPPPPISQQNHSH